MEQAKTEQVRLGHHLKFDGHTAASVAERVRAPIDDLQSQYTSTTRDLTHATQTLAPSPPSGRPDLAMRVC
jgi:hypothetical protein